MATELEPLIEAVRAGDSPEARAAVRELGGIDDDRARHALAAALAGDGPLAAMASRALGQHGKAAQSFAVAATMDPARRFGGLVALGQIGDPSSRSILRELVEDPDPMVRAVAAIGLYRCGERDGALFSSWIGREGAMTVFGFLAAIGGDVKLGVGALDNLDAQARLADTPAGIRASCAWAVAQHDAARGRELADALRADPAAAGALADVVARRGGPLASQLSGGDPSRDPTADTVGLPRP